MSFLKENNKPNFLVKKVNNSFISWQNVFNKPVQGYSHDKNDYIAYISFYSKNSKIDDSVLMHMSLWDFENKFGNL